MIVETGKTSSEHFRNNRFLFPIATGLRIDQEKSLCRDSIHARVADLMTQVSQGGRGERVACDIKICDFCRLSIAAGQRWVRKKAYDAGSNCRDPAYRHFHAERFEGQQGSCWEELLMEREIARTAAVTPNGMASRSGALPLSQHLDEA
jgi:hypothetical protein